MNTPSELAPGGPTILGHAGDSSGHGSLPRPFDIIAAHHRRSSSRWSISVSQLNAVFLRLVRSAYSSHALLGICRVVYPSAYYIVSRLYGISEAKPRRDWYSHWRYSELECLDGKYKDGKPITPKGEYTTRLISHPAPFECAITPRSRQSESLIAQALESKL
ncbi:hypothetical protein DFH11DRAFT_1544131 [Phellopilus nigrolimitatus]|nr:hypothetical protein DFH11DRAFT_1544131 [Phellopilus nigrolimitatus]